MKTNIYSMLHDEYLNPWYIWLKPEPLRSLLPGV